MRDLNRFLGALPDDIRAELVAEKWAPLTEQALRLFERIPLDRLHTYIRGGFVCASKNPGTWPELMRDHADRLLAAAGE